MASITKFRTISAVDDQRVQLVNSNFARPWDTVAIGTGWTKIRVACRLSITDSGSNVTSTPRFAIGICSGSTNIFQDATTTHFCGIMSNNATWSRIVGPPVGYNIGASGTWVVTKRIGAVTTSNTSIGGLVNSTFYDVTTANRTAFFITITKGSPTFTIQIFTRSSATASDVALAEFLTQVELVTPTIANHGLNTASNNTIAIDEAVDGFFDHACVAWDRTTPNIEVSDLSVVRLT